MQAFWELSSCRDYGGGVTGPIPWTAIMQYADRSRMDADMTDIFLNVIRALDSVWIEYQSKNSK